MRILIMLAMSVFLLACNGVQHNAMHDPSVDWSQVEIRNKPDSSNEKIELGKTGYLFFYDSNKWSVSESDNMSIVFENNDGTASAHVVYERIQVPMDRIPEYVRMKFDDMFSNAKLHDSTKKVVNGMLVNSYTITYDADFSKVIAICYSCSKKSGTIQIRVFTTENLFVEKRLELEEFLDGIANNIS